MTVVIKRNLNREKFDAGKLRRSIDRAASEAGIAPMRRKALVDRVARAVTAIAGRQSRVRSAVLRDWILFRLDKAAPGVSRAWRDHDRETKGIA